MVEDDDASDVQLIARSKRGDRRAFGLLVRRYQKKVYALCFRLGGSHDVADDLTQEAFIKAFQAIDSFDEKYQFGAWISRIASNNALNYLSRQKFQVSGAEAETILEGRASVEKGTDPHEVLSQKEMDARYLQAVNELPIEFRVVFVMRMHEEMSYDEIAKTLKINAGTVMSRLHRARLKLVESLKDILEP
jgi:RNA polymerase sigma-70 factor (ECF subfamily)